MKQRRFCFTKALGLSCVQTALRAEIKTAGQTDSPGIGDHFGVNGFPADIGLMLCFPLSVVNGPRRLKEAPHPMEALHLTEVPHPQEGFVPEAFLHPGEDRLQPEDQDREKEYLHH